MKKVVSILLVTVFLLQTLGLYLVFKFKQAEIRCKVNNEIDAELPDERLVLLKFDMHFSDETGNNLRWTDDNEFIYNGKMFDVLRMEKHGSEGIWFYCLADEKETKLVTDFRRQMNDHMNNDSKTTHQLTKTFLFFSNDSLSPETTVFRQFVGLSGLYRFTVISEKMLPDTPPPEFKLPQRLSL